MTKLDELSRLIGGMEKQLENVNRRMQEDREAANLRHRENADTLQQIDGRVENLERSVAPLTETVAQMKPIVESVLVTRWKLAGALGLMGVLVTGVGWLVVLMVDKLGGWFWSLFHLPK